MSRSCKQRCLLISKREVFGCCLGQFKPSLASGSPSCCGIMGCAGSGMRVANAEGGFHEILQAASLFCSLSPPTVLLAASHPRQPSQAQLQVV